MVPLDRTDTVTVHNVLDWVAQNTEEELVRNKRMWDAQRRRH